jgi:hypothetical protein
MYEPKRLGRGPRLSTLDFAGTFIALSRTRHGQILESLEIGRGRIISSMRPAICLRGAHSAKFPLRRDRDVNRNRDIGVLLSVSGCVAEKNHEGVVDQRVSLIANWYLRASIVSQQFGTEFVDRVKEMVVDS